MKILILILNLIIYITLNANTINLFTHEIFIDSPYLTLTHIIKTTQDVVLSPKLLPGQSYTIYVSNINNKLINIKSAFNIKSPYKRIKITRKKGKISEKTLKSIIKKYINIKDKIKIHIKSIYGIIPTKIKIITLLSKPKIGHQALKLLIKNKYNETYKITVYVRLTVLKRLAVATHTLKKGEIITKNDFEIKQVEINSVYEYQELEYVNPLGLCATRTIKGNSIIKGEYLTTPILIKRGSIVTIEKKIGNITITLRGIALESGSLNDIIRIKNLTSNKIITGKVISPNKIQAL